MNDSNNSSKGLLVLKLKTSVTADMIDDLLAVISPTADALGVEPLVLPPNVDVELQMGSSALLERVCVALEEIAAQGRAPEVVNAAESAPQALNARHKGLNDRPHQKDPIDGLLNRHG